MATRVSKGVLLVAALASAACLGLPASAAAKAGDVYVVDESADGGNGAVFRVAPGGGTATSFATNTALFEEPWGMVMDSDRSLLVADYSTNKILRVSRSGAVSEFFSDPSQMALTDLDWGPDGNLYVLDYVKHNIIRLDPDTKAFTEVADNTGVPDWTSGNEIVVARDLTIYFTSANGNDVFQVSPGGAVTKLYEGPLLTDAFGLLLSPDERWLYVGDNADGQIIRVNRQTGAASPFADLAPAGPAVTGLAQLRDGDFLAGDHDNDRVNRLGASGSPVTTFSGGPGFDYPVDPVVEPPLCGGKLATVVGTDSRDVIKGSRFADVVATLNGNDVVKGLAGNDIACGGKGRDRLLGGKGRDRLFGNGGRDRLIGGKGKDKLKGGPGRDTQRQ